MTPGIENIITVIRNENNFSRYHNIIIFLLVLIICLFKIPSILSSDIQPWDEGMYAVRVLSIHIYGDFFDQSVHSVAGFDSGSHPPLLIWLGYFATLLSGVNGIVLKLIPLIFTLLCVFYLIKTGKELNSFIIGFLASLIFSGSFLISIYSGRFQLDIPVTFFILASFYYFILFIKRNDKRYLIYCGTAFGLCLMTKAFAGLFIPIILFASYFFLRKKIRIHISDLIKLTVIGLIIALPWHLYMTIKHGNEFTNFLFGFHLLSRAFENHEGIKSKGIYYFPNILLNNIPFGILLFISFAKDAKNFIFLNWEKIFLWIWFLSGFIIISIFKTKLETYLLPFLAPACILLVIYLVKEQNKSSKEKVFILFLTLFNIIWFAVQSVRNEIKIYLFNLNQVLSFYEITIAIISFAVLVIILFYVFRALSRKIDFSLAFFVLIFISFVCLNIFYIIKVPGFENSYVLSEIKNDIDQNFFKSGRKKILYVSTDFKYNPQFTFYFEGIDLGWKNKLNYELAELKNGTDKVNKLLEELPKEEYNVIIERDNINPGIYYDTRTFLPERYKLVRKNCGYELYED